MLDAEGERAISEAQAAQAAVAAYRHAKAAVEALSAARGRLDPVARLRVLCHLQHQQCSVAQQQARLGREAQRAAAAGELQRCLAEGLALGCPADGGDAERSTAAAGGQPDAAVRRGAQDEL